ncbi:DUF664 domain-containing protein [Nocardioides speluncae]|uniref:mycothiol transferase n=1 Tax=Nocardioides speluncae TaxID=2670337 RepID=UPI000D6992AC|nr:DUF664 domain-containing protein [Nocardioides speluncae]
MTEDNRKARNPGEPPKSGPAGAERWVGFLDWVREEMIDGVLGLSAAEQRTTRLRSRWTPIELLSHVTHMEQRWFVWGFLGEPVDDPWGDWSVDDPTISNPDGRWVVADEVTAEELVARLRAIGERTRAILAEHPLDATGATGGRFTENPPTLEWICFHVLAEYARHAGHLDIAVELGRGQAPSTTS